MLQLLHIFLKYHHGISLFSHVLVSDFFWLNVLVFFIYIYKNQLKWCILHCMVSIKRWPIHLIDLMNDLV